MKKPFIFITNDDGVNAKGLAHLIEAARLHGRILVIAPETSQSGMSHAITIASPLFLRSVRKEPDLEIYACTGTPVDCVKMAFDHLLKGKKVDLVVSGINHGTNSAISVLYSGTMGAAIEGSFYGVPSIGFSLLDFLPDADFEAATIHASQMIGQILEKPIELPLCLNVNIPIGRPEEIKGVRVCRQSKGYWKEEFYCRKDPRGRDYYWLTGNFQNDEPDAPDTDEWALKHGYISVVPIQVDMTDYQQIDPLKQRLGHRE